MIEHICIPNIKYQKQHVLEIYQCWLENWLYNLEKNIEKGDICISECFQGVLSEIILYGNLKTDWKGIIEEYLTDKDENPIAYSEEYGKRLFKFEEQWKQTSVFAVYNHWWIMNASGNTKDNEKYSYIMENFIQNNGWIYNPMISNTQIRTRMKTELLMSMSMGLEVLNKKLVNEKYQDIFTATVSSLPITGYIGAEYFRLKSLDTLNKICLAPDTRLYDELIRKCSNEIGYNDFNVDDKIDDYMGTKKRTNRDKAICSPLINMLAMKVAEYCGSKISNEVVSNIVNVSKSLQ